MKNNTKTTKTSNTNKTTAQKIYDVAHKEVFLKNIDRDVMTKSVMILSLAINIVTLVVVILLLGGVQLS